MFGKFISISPPKPSYEVADVFRLYIDEYRQKNRTSWRQEEVIRAIMACRTPQMGGLLNECEECGALQFVFRACGDSHCPKCGKYRKAEWVAKQEKLVLPIPYFHVTFTTDHALNRLIENNQQVMLDTLFWAVSQTIKEYGRKELGGQVGVTAVLHTWGQTMIPHVHIHCIVTGGALSQEGKRFQKSQARYLFEVVAFSASYRDRLCRRIKRLAKGGKLKGDKAEILALVAEIKAKSWEVFIKAFEEVENLYQYLSRYVHQVAISNQRIIGIDRRAKTVTFRYKDNKDGGQEKEMTLPAESFIRRFLWHVLPRGLWRIRHYGLHHGSCRKKLEQARSLLGLERAIPETEALGLREWLMEIKGEDVLNRCPNCGQDSMYRRAQYEDFSFVQLLLISLVMLVVNRRRVAMVR